MTILHQGSGLTARRRASPFGNPCITPRPDKSLLEDDDGPKNGLRIFIEDLGIVDDMSRAELFPTAVAVVAGLSLDAAVFRADELKETAKLVVPPRGLKVRFLDADQIAALTSPSFLR